MRIYNSTKTLPRLGHTVAIDLKIRRLAMSSGLIGCVDIALGASVPNKEGDTTTGIGAGVVGKANGCKGGQNCDRDGVMHCC